MKENAVASAEYPAGFEGQVRYIKAPGRSSVADTADVVALVQEILQAVRTRGDAAVREYALRFDKVELTAARFSTDAPAAPSVQPNPAPGRSGPSAGM